MKKSFLLPICYLMFFTGYGQSQNQWEEVSIYEAGDSITSFETNFENLFQNWTRENVTNAGEFELRSYEFVENLNDAQTFQFYRNFFSGDEAVSISMRGSTIVNAMGRVKELYIMPGYPFRSNYLDTAKLPQKARNIISTEFYQAMEDQINREINIDSLKLNYYNYEYTKYDTTEERMGRYKIVSNSREQSSHYLARMDSLSADYQDIMIHHTKSIFDLPLQEAREFVLEDILVNRIGIQRNFNEVVSLGDKVYVIHFTYNGKDYSNYVICDADSKKVIYDNVFLGIKILNKG